MNLKELNNAEIAMIMEADNFYLLRRSTSELNKVLNSWLKKLLYVKLLLPDSKENDICFLRTMCRDDYKDLFHSIIEASDLQGSLILEDFILESASINMNAMFYLNNHRKSAITRLQNLPYKNEHKALLAVRLIYYSYIIDSLEQYSFSKLVCFSDMQPIECFASIYYNKKNVITVTMQHGLYIEYNDVNTINVINYKNQPSNYFLAWGEDTKKLIEKYNDHSNVILCGKPNIYKTSIKDINFNSLTILIICDQEINQEANFNLIRIIENTCANTQWKFSIRFHPQNNKAFYNKTLGILTEAKEEFFDYDIVVGISSSMLYELSECGHRVFQFDCSVNTITLDESLRFSTNKELIDKMKNYKEKTTSSNLFHAISKNSKLLYQQFFNKLISKNNTEKIPFFTIIIPVYNGSLHIYKALDSLLHQTFTDFEVLIMDGNSQDCTVEYTLHHVSNDKRFKVFSEPDKGIYDAMNKGVAKAKGQWIYFLGSDDQFFNECTLQDTYIFISSLKETVGFVYGNVLVKGNVKWAKDGTKYDGKFDDLKIKKKNICHQAIFYNKEKKLKYAPYNLKYKLCADWDINLKIWANEKTKYFDQTIAVFNAGGASTDGSDPIFGKDFKNNINDYFSDNYSCEIHKTN